MFKMRNQNRFDQDIKLHYKMYKAGKRWIVAGVAMMSFGLVLAGKPQFVQAAVTDPQTSEAVAKVKADQQDGTAAKTAAQVNQAKTQTAAGAPTAETKAQDSAKTAENATVVKSAIKTDTSVSDKTTVETPASEQSKTAAQTDAATTVQSTNRTGQTQTAGKTADVQSTDSKTTDKPADSTTTTQKPAAQTDEKKAVTKANTKADTQTDAKDAKTDTKTDTKADPKKTADDDYQTAKDKTDHANALAAKANQSAAALQALLKDPKPNDTAWLTQVNAALNDLAKASSDFTGTKVNTDEVVAAYQAALKNLPNQPQPSAIDKVQVGSKDEAATLANYNKLVDAYTTQVNTILAKVKNGQANYAAAEALAAAQKQLKTAADQLNAAIKQAVDSANQGDTAAAKHAVTAPDAAGRTLDDYKNAYDDALTAYNSNVTVYNDTTTDSAQKITPVGTNADAAAPADPTKNPSQKDYDQFKDEVAKAAVQNNAHNQYETANTAYNQAKGTFADLGGAVAGWQTAVDHYNAIVTGVNKGQTAAGTQKNLQAQQKAVTDAQNALANAVKAFQADNGAYKEALAKYQKALKDYADQTGQPVQAVAPDYDSADPQSTWNQFQDSITKLQNDFTGTGTDTVPAQNETIMQKNNDQLQAMQMIGATAKDLQTKINQINQAASAQQAAVDNWNNEISAAQKDGRWAFFYPQLQNDGNDLTQKDYAYIDAINGTTTTFTSETKAADYGKTYTQQQVDKTTPNYSDQDYATAGVTQDPTKASYAYLVNAYLKAVAAYNATAKDKIATGDPADADQVAADAANLKTSLEGTDGFTVQFQKLINTLAGMAADPDQNATALASLKKIGNFSTDGSHPAQDDYTDGPQTVQSMVILASGTWADVLSSNKGKSVYKRDDSFKPNQYTFVDDGKGHQLAATAIHQLFTNGWTKADYDPSSFTLTPEYTADNGQKYYLAGYGIYQASNLKGNLKHTSQLYAFTDENAEQEMVKNGLMLSGDPSQNTYIYFYYLPTGISDQLIPKPDPVGATAVKTFVTPTLQLTPVASYDTAKAVPVPTVTAGVTANGPAYLAGTPVTPDFQSPDTTIQGAPTITLNQPKAPSTPGTPGGPGSGTPDDPSTPTTPSEPSTPGEPSTPDKPGTPTTPDQPGTPSKPGQPGQPGTPVTPGQPSKPGTPTTSGQTGQHDSQGGHWSNLTSNTQQAGQVRGSRRTLRQVVSLPGHQMARTQLPQTGEHRSTGLMAVGAALMAMSLVFGWTLTDRKRRQD